MRFAFRLLILAGLVALPVAALAEPVPYAAWEAQPPDARAVIVGAMFDGMTLIPHTDSFARFTRHWQKCIEDKHLTAADIAEGVYAVGHDNATYQHSRLFLALTTYLQQECGPAPVEPM